MYVPAAPPAKPPPAPAAGKGRGRGVRRGRGRRRGRRGPPRGRGRRGASTRGGRCRPRSGRRPAPPPRGRGKLEAQEVHRRRLLFGGPLEVLVRDRPHGSRVAHLRPDPVLDADHPAEGGPALVLVVELDHERRLPVRAVRDERVVGIELGLDLRRLEDPLGAEDLLHLVVHGEAVLEVEGRVGADRQPARALVPEHPLAERGAFGRVALEAQEVFSGQLVHRMVRRVSWVAGRTPGAARRGSCVGGRAAGLVRRASRRAPPAVLRSRRPCGAG